MTSIFEACRSGDSETVKRLIAEDQTVIHSTDSAGKACLFRAVEGGSFEMVKLLLSHKADPNKGGDVLHLIASGPSVSMKSVMMADVLVKAKADVNSRNADGEVALQLVLKRLDRDSNSIVGELRKVFHTQIVETPKSARPIKRSESLTKLLEFRPSPKKLEPPSSPINNPETPRSPVRKPETPPSQVRKPETPPSQVRKPLTPPKEELVFLQPPHSVTPVSPTLRAPSREDAFSHVLELEREIEKLKAENAALRDEVKRYRSTMSKFDARQQLKELFARLIELESIESALEAINP